MVTDHDLSHKQYRWKREPNYATAIDWGRNNPCLLEVSPEFGPNETIQPKESFNTYRAFELIHSKDESRERKGLAYRKFFRVVSPWVMENPIYMHLRSNSEIAIKKAIDQCAEIGFEMVILSFGSGYNIENNSQENLQFAKRVADYGAKKGIALGTYSLLASRSISKEVDIVPPKGKRAFFRKISLHQYDLGQRIFQQTIQFL